MIIKRLILSVTVAVALSIATIAVWSALKNTSENQIARVAEAESYAARSQLVRNIDVMLAAMQNVRTFWSVYGHLPREQWSSDAGVELEHFAGMRMILWDDPERDKRYARTETNPRFDYRPGDEEWQSFADLLARGRAVGKSTILGPYLSDDGNQTIEIVVFGLDRTDTSMMAAIVNVEELLGAFLTDQSPGFAIRVFSGDTVIYKRGQVAAGAPENWTRGGFIQSSFGSLWRVEHLPTTAFTQSFSNPAIDSVLLLGIIVAILLGALVYENGRAQYRAAAAEKAENTVSELNRGLEQVVEHRTRELRNRSVDLQTLADSVAHDLRNPLGTMSLNLQLLEELAASKLTNEEQTVLRRLFPCIEQMADILDRLLGLSLVANSTFEREEIQMLEFVKETFAEHCGVSADFTLNFVVDELPDAYADRNLLHVLLTNLFSNALKFTRTRHEKVIKVTADNVGGETIYSVSDNGIGFDKDVSEKIFDAFDRGGTDGNKEGIGLGLTLAKRVIERHGGRIWADSTSDKGATFYFTLAPPEHGDVADG